jgi:prophage regulatory protein
MNYRILRLREVMAQTGMSRSWIYKAISEGAFPQQVKLGRASGWDAGAVEDWLRQKLNRDGVSPSLECRS